jgi:DNA-directed RNA polymerase specialized sigma24 family protein
MEPLETNKEVDVAPREWFSTTHWSTVLAAADHGSAQSAEALEKLCRAYWYPLYAHVRQRGHDATEAEDLTQEFFLRFLAKDYLTHLRRGRGRFRNYLLTALNHFLADEWDRERRVKRGGGVRPLRIDFEAGEEFYRDEPVDQASPDRLYERRWALAALQYVLAQLREEYEQKGKGRLFDVLKNLLVDDPEELPWASACVELGMSEGALRIAAHRLRRRYGELFRREIANTVSTPEEIDEEMRYLLAVLSG